MLQGHVAESETRSTPRVSQSGLYALLTRGPEPRIPLISAGGPGD